MLVFNATNACAACGSHATASVLLLGSIHVRPRGGDGEAPGWRWLQPSEAPPRGCEAPGGLGEVDGDAPGVPQGGGPWGFRLAHISFIKKRGREGAVDAIMCDGGAVLASVCSKCSFLFRSSDAGRLTGRAAIFETLRAW